LARAKAKANDPAAMQPLLSAVLCRSAIARKSAVEELKKEQGFAKKEGREADQEILDAIQRKQKAADENTAIAKSKLKELKRKPLPCSANAVVRFSDCFSSGERTGDCALAVLVEAPDL
jgi:hypothetical protein